MQSLKEDISNKKIYADNNQKEWLCLRNIIRSNVFAASFSANYADTIIGPNNIFFAFQQKNTISRGYIEKKLCSNNKLFSTIGEAVNCDDFIKNRERKFIGSLMATFFNDKQFINSLKQKFGNKLNIQKYLNHEYGKKLEAADNILIEHVNKFDSIYNSIIRHTGYGDFFHDQGPLNLHLNFDDDKEGRLWQMLRDFNGSIYYANKGKNPNALEYLRKMSCYMNVAFFENKYLSSDTPPSQRKIDFWVAVSSFLNDEQKDYLSQIMNAKDSELSQEQKDLRYRILNDNDFQDKIINLWSNSFENMQVLKNKGNIKIDDFKVNRQQLSFIMHVPESKLNKQQKMFKDKFLRIASKWQTEELRKMMDKSQPQNLESIKPITDLLEKDKITFIPSCVKIIGDENKDKPIENISVREKNMPDELKNEIEKCLFANEKKYLKLKDYSENHVNYLVNKIMHDDEELKDIYITKNKFIKAFFDRKLKSYFSEEKKEDRSILLEALRRIALESEETGKVNDLLSHLEEWLFLRDHMYNKVFGAAGLIYETINLNEFDLKLSANAICMLSYYGTEVYLCKNNVFISPEHCLDKVDNNKLMVLLSTLPKALANKNIKNINDSFGDVSLLLETKKSSSEKVIAENETYVKLHIHNFDRIKYSICRHASYKSFFYAQATSSINLNFDIDNAANLSQILKCFHVSNFYINKDNNYNPIEYLRKLSCYMTVAFFENKYLTSEMPPDQNKIYFWVAVNSLLDEDQKNYLSQIMNANDNELNQKQRDLKNKILNDNKFIEDIIWEWKRSFNEILDANDNEVDNEVDNESDGESDNDNKIVQSCNFKVNKQHLYFIMHAPESDLTHQQKIFKNKFLEAAYKISLLGNKNIDGLKEMISKTNFDNLVKIKEITSVLTPENRIFIPSCIKIIGNDNKSEDVVKNVSVREKDMPENLRTEMKICLFENEKRYLKFEQYSLAYVNYLVNKIVGADDDNNKNLKDIYIDRNKFIKAIADGELNLYFVDKNNKVILVKAIKRIISEHSNEKDSLLRIIDSSRKLNNEVKDKILEAFVWPERDQFLNDIFSGQNILNKNLDDQVLSDIVKKINLYESEAPKVINNIFKCDKLSNEHKKLLLVYIFRCKDKIFDRKDISLVLCKLAEEYLDFDNWRRDFKDKKIISITKGKFKSLTEIYQRYDEFFNFVINGEFNEFLLYPDSVECKIVNELVDEKISLYLDAKNEILTKLYKMDTLPLCVKHYLIKKYPIENEWQGIRKQIFNMVFGAAALDYSHGTLSESVYDLISCAMAVFRLEHYVTSVQFFKNNTVVSIEDAVDTCDTDRLWKLISNIYEVTSPICQSIKSILMKKFKITEEEDLDKVGLYKIPENNKFARSLLKDYIKCFDKIKYLLCSHASYNAFFYTQGTINLNLNFDDDKDKRLEDVLKDFNRSPYYKYIPENPKSMEYRRKLSCYANVAFYENKYLESEFSPDENKIYFWVAVNSLLDEDQKNYLSQIMNAPLIELNSEQKNLRYKILYDKKFQDDIIDEWKASFGEIPDQNDEKLIEQGLFKVNRQQLSFIMHAPENNLNKQQIDFRNKFFIALGKAENLGVVRKMLDKSEIKNINKLKQITDLLDAKKRTFIPSCIKIIGNKVNSEEPVKNISVREKDAPEELKAEIANCLFYNEKKYLKPDKYSYEHKYNLRNIAGITNYKYKDYSAEPNNFLQDIADGKLDFCFKEKGDVKPMLQAIDFKIKFCGIDMYKNLSILVKGEKTPNIVKRHLVDKYQLQKVNGFIKSLYRGNFELDKQTARIFLIALYDECKKDLNSGTNLLKEIYNDKKALLGFKKFLSELIGVPNYFFKNNLDEFVKELKTAQNIDAKMDSLIDQYFDSLKTPERAPRRKSAYIYQGNMGL